MLPWGVPPYNECPVLLLLLGIIFFGARGGLQYCRHTYYWGWAGRRDNCLQLSPEWTDTSLHTPLLPDKLLILSFSGTFHWQLSGLEKGLLFRLVELGPEPKTHHQPGLDGHGLATSNRTSAVSAPESQDTAVGA